MGRSTKDAWLSGPGDLSEAEVEDVPVRGSSVLVRALPAAYSNKARSEAQELKIVGNDQVVTINAEKLEILQFQYGVVDPQFTYDEAEQIAQRYGRAFRKVISKIDELSDLNMEAISEAAERFPAGREGEGRADVGDADGTGDSRPPVPA